MSVLSDKLRQRYPFFEDSTEFPDALLDDFIADAFLEIDAGVWGCYYDRAAVALAAHSLEMRQRSLSAGSMGAGVGQVTQLKTEKETITFARTTSNTGDVEDAIYSSTIGGQEYLRLCGKVYAGPYIVI